MPQALVLLQHPTALNPTANASQAQGTPDPLEDNAANDAIEQNLVGYIKGCYEEARAFRQREGINDDLLAALRSVRGEYDPLTLSDIKQFGGSEIYARITANKVRTIAAMLREVYTASDRPWALTPTSEPTLDTQDLTDAVNAEMQAEMAELQQAGTTVDALTILRRREQVREQIAATRAKLAADAALERENYLDDFLQQGGFYQALWDFLLDLCTFPFAVIKGPTVRYANRLAWKNGQPTLERKPVLEWSRRSPFDVYFAPWSRNVQDGYVIDVQRVTRANLEALKGLPSYNTARIQEVLDNDPATYREWHEYIETERANLEDRQPDNWGTSSHAVDRPYSMIEFHGAVSTKLLREWGMSSKDAPPNAPDVQVVAYLISNVVIGVRKNPHPLGTKPFYVDSLERVPGSLYGLGVPGLINDIQAAGNATLRALVNNMAISSGPQVGINADRMKDGDTNYKLWPWRVWPFVDSVYGAQNSGSVPVQFFQPESNAEELLAVFEKFLDMADSFSSLPRLVSGDVTGAATLGRSASGISMVMNAANRTVKQVVTSIDNTVVTPLIEDLNVYVSLLDPDAPTDGDINVIARGATELVEREALRQRRLEFLQITDNPVDMQLTGPGGRFEILREIARDLKLPADKVFAGAAAATAKFGAAAPLPPGASPAPGGQPSPGGQPAPGQAIPMPPQANQTPQPSNLPSVPQPPAPAQGMMQPSTT